MESEAQEVAVKVDTSTLAMSSSGSITGVVAISVSGNFFPAPNWDDFPVVILNWWLEPLSRILDGRSNLWNCRFMDGPVLMQIMQLEDDLWCVTGLHNDSVEFKAKISCRVFIQSLLYAAREVLAACINRGWKSRDIDNLASTLREIDSSQSVQP